MATLRELSSNYKALADMLENLELIDDKESIDYAGQKKAIEDTMESIEPILTEKVDNYCLLIRDKQANIEAIANEIKRLQDRKRTLENSVAWLKQNLQFTMEQQGVKQVKTDFNTCSIAKSGTRKLTLKVDPEELPEQFRQVEYKADNKALRDYFKEQDIEENLLAVLEPASESLRIR